MDRICARALFTPSPLAATRFRSRLLVLIECICWRSRACYCYMCDVRVFLCGCCCYNCQINKRSLLPLSLPLPPDMPHAPEHAHMLNVCVGFSTVMLSKANVYRHLCWFDVRPTHNWGLCCACECVCMCVGFCGEHVSILIQSARTRHTHEHAHTMDCACATRNKRM